ncbi:hypothetical protein FB451DRAFT_1310526 [Mycena latifolia]|nr:hypothetical protein FB451DRAFT_1310526 [Mycena latifolia]
MPPLPSLSFLTLSLRPLVLVGRMHDLDGSRREHEPHVPSHLQIPPGWRRSGHPCHLRPSQYRLRRRVPQGLLRSGNPHWRRFPPLLPPGILVMVVVRFAPRRSEWRLKFRGVGMRIMHPMRNTALLCGCVARRVQMRRPEPRRGVRPSGVGIITVAVGLRHCCRGAAPDGARRVRESIALELRGRIVRRVCRRVRFYRRAERTPLCSVRGCTGVRVVLHGGQRQEGMCARPHRQAHWPRV